MALILSFGKAMKVHLASLGCKLNQSEMDRLREQLAAAGWVLAPAGDADVLVLNTCAVTAEAARKSRQALRRLRSQAPNAKLVAAGCYAELWPDEVAAAAGPDLMVGNRDKERLAEILQGLGVETAPSQQEEPLSRPRTRAFIKIQDGCDNACAYCVVHVARGRSRSVPPAEVVTEVRRAVEAGHREVVLTGVNIGAYGEDEGGHDLGGLVRLLLRETSVERLRLSSVEPWSFREEWLELWASPRLCRHLHLPLQSGSDAVLERMNRPYRAADFAALARAVQKAVPAAALTTDIIVGFPGETEAEFRETAALVESVGFARTHVFPFSARPGTPAAGMAAQVASGVTQMRCRELRAAAARAASEFAARFAGQTLDVLWEQRRQDGRWAGLTDNYLRVYTEANQDLRNRITPTALKEPVGGGLRGQVVEIDKGVAAPL